MSENIFLEGYYPPEGNPNPEELYLRREREAEIYNKLPFLNQYQQKLIISRMAKPPLSFTQLANMLGKNRSTVCKHYYDALKLIADHYNKEDA